MSFPAAPDINDEYEVGTRKWRWSGVAWELVASPGTLINPLKTMKVQPISAHADVSFLTDFYSPVVVVAIEVS